MSRSGYAEDGENWDFIKYRGIIASATRGKRGQTFFRELLEALDAMEVKRLISHDLVAQGEFCTIGVLASAKGIDLTQFDIEDDAHAYPLGQALDVTHQLVSEIEFMNDEAGLCLETPESRWRRMRDWVAKQIIEVSDDI